MFTCARWSKNGLLTQKSTFVVEILKAMLITDGQYENEITDYIIVTIIEY